jgi:hypothetical protein
MARSKHNQPVPAAAERKQEFFLSGAKKQRTLPPIG